MALYKNVASQKVAVYAHDTANDVPKTGDAANITAQVSKDGGATAASNDTNPTELDATDAPGIYLFDLAQAESNCDLFILFAKSSTSDIQLEPVIAYTLPGTSSGVTPAEQVVRDAMKLTPTAGAPSSGSIDSIVSTIDTNVSTALADTDELQTDWTNGGRLDLILDTVNNTTAGSSVVTGMIFTNTDIDIPVQIAALNDLSPAQVNAEVVDVLRTDLIPDSYPADGVQPTIAQAILAIHQFLMEKGVVGTTLTVRKPDGATTAMTFTLDNGPAPTDITRS